MYILLKKVIQKRLPMVIFILLLQGITTIVSLIAPYINGKFVDILTDSKQYKNVLKFTEIVFLINITGILIGYLFRILQLRLKSYVSFELNLKIILHLQKIPIEKFERFQPTYLNQRIRGDCETITNFWINNILSVIINIIALVVMFILLININITLFLVILIFIPIYYIVYILLRRPLYDRGRESTESSNVFMSNLNEIYERNREIKTDVLFEYENDRLSKGFFCYFGNLMRYNKLAYKFTSIDSVISLLFQIIVFLIGGSQVIRANISIGAFTMLSSYFSMIMDIIKYYFELSQSYQNMKVSVNRVDDLLEIDLEKNGINNVDKINNIKVENINYSYNNHNIYINEMHLQFNEPNVYVIIGKNGIGKTTLANIIIGINNLNLKGKIYINNMDLSEIDMYALRKNRFSIMFQEKNNTSESVEEYIYKYISEERIISLKSDSLCKKVFFSELVNLDTLMKKRMNDLSSGERQMVQLFTKVYKVADVYIFDEPTSNVHPQLINYILDILDMLKQLHKIVIVITHDINVKNRFDKCYDLDNILKTDKILTIN